MAERSGRYQPRADLLPAERPTLGPWQCFGSTGPGSDGRFTAGGESRSGADRKTPLGSPPTERARTVRFARDLGEPGLPANVLRGLNPGAVRPGRTGDLSRPEQPPSDTIHPDQHPRPIADLHLYANRHQRNSAHTRTNQYAVRAGPIMDAPGSHLYTDAGLCHHSPPVQ